MRLFDRIHPFALLALRLALGAILLANALPSSIGGFRNTAHFVASSLGWLAALLWGVELIGGAALVLGAATRFFAFAILLDLLVAVFKAHRTNGLVGPGGYEFPLALATIAFAIIILGAGPISADWLFARKKGF